MATAQCTWNGWILASCKHVKHILGDCSAASLTNKALLKHGRPITSCWLPDYLISQEAGSANALGEKEQGEERRGVGVAQVFLFSPVLGIH